MSNETNQVPMEEQSDETSDAEVTPKHKKQAKSLIILLIVVIVGFMIFDVVRQAFDSKEEEAPQQIAVQEIPTGNAKSTFEEQFQQELDRQKAERQKPLQSNETSDEVMKRLQNKQIKTEEQINQTPVATDQQKVDITQEFKDSEKRRALNARRSPFTLKRKNNAQMATTKSPMSNPALSAPLSQNTLNKEKNRVMQEIQRLDKMRQGGSPSGDMSVPGFIPQSFTPGGGPGPGGSEIVPISATTSSNQNPVKQITVGQPASKGAPEQGQKLISTGTVINAVLDQTLMSDYTGSYRGMITHDIYDVTGEYIIIPKRSRFTGSCLRISNVNEPIQARMGLTVKWIILPNGKRIDLKKIGDMLDREGIHAVKDKVNYHFIAQFLGVAAYALVSAETSREGSGISQDVTYEGQVGEAMREQFAPVAAKYLDLVPTITLRSGTPIKIFLEDDIYAHEWKSIYDRLIKANRSSY